MQLPVHSSRVAPAAAAPLMVTARLDLDAGVTGRESLEMHRGLADRDSVATPTAVVKVAALAEATRAEDKITSLIAGMDNKVSNDGQGKARSIMLVVDRWLRLRADLRRKMVHAATNGFDDRLITFTFIVVLFATVGGTVGMVIGAAVGDFECAIGGFWTGVVCGVLFGFLFWSGKASLVGLEWFDAMLHFHNILQIPPLPDLAATVTARDLWQLEGFLKENRPRLQSRIIPVRRPAHLYLRRPGRVRLRLTSSIAERSQPGSSKHAYV